MAGLAGRAVAELGTSLLALLGVGQHLGGTLLAKDLLARVGTHKADKVVDGGLVRADGVEQRVCGGICVVALGDSVLPGLRGALGVCRGRRIGVTV